jgi:SAM-dependent methyltransferase
MGDGHDLMNQLTYWEDLHTSERLDPFSRQASPFARKVAACLRAPHRILELGCGTGADAVYFNKLGHEVIATDGSAKAISANSCRGNESLRFAVQDMREPFSFASGSFALVYARLSIHYFSDEETRRIVDEVHRVLDPGGRFFFMCKSVQDPLCGQGVLVGPNIYNLGGHVRHFFSPDYIRDIFEPRRFLVEGLLTSCDRLYGYDTAFIEEVAAKI